MADESSFDEKEEETQRKFTFFRIITVIDFLSKVKAFYRKSKSFDDLHSLRKLQSKLYSQKYWILTENAIRKKNKQQSGWGTSDSCNPKITVSEGVPYDSGFCAYDKCASSATRAITTNSIYHYCAKHFDEMTKAHKNYHFQVGNDLGNDNILTDKFTRVARARLELEGREKFANKLKMHRFHFFRFVLILHSCLGFYQKPWK
jgi:hypothetical protein